MKYRWIDRSSPRIDGSNVIAGLPGEKTEWQMTIRGGSNRGNLVDDLHYYHDSGVKLTAYSLTDGTEGWEVAPQDLETYGEARMISGDLLVTASAATIRDRHSGEFKADLRPVLNCPDPNGTFGAASYGYLWNGNILLQLQKLSRTFYLVDSNSFEVNEFDLNGSYIMADTNEYAVLLAKEMQGAIEIYRKQGNQHLVSIQDPSFEFQKYRTKYSINGNTLLTGTKSATDFILWDIATGEKVEEFQCAYPETAVMEESRLGNLDGIITDSGDFMVFRHFQKDTEGTQVNEIWRLNPQNGEATLSCDFDRRFRTDSGIFAGDIFFLDKKNDNGTFSPCAINWKTGKVVWQYDHASRFGYEIHLSLNHVVFTERTPDPCEVLCFSWQ